MQKRRSSQLSYGPVIMSRYDAMKKMEVIQPQVPLRLPCDDLTLLTEPRFDISKKRGLT